MDAERERKKQTAIVKQKQREHLCNNYFNYDNFSEAAYNKELQSVLEQCQRQKKTLNEALEMTQAFPSQYLHATGREFQNQCCQCNDRHFGTKKDTQSILSPSVR